MGTPMMKKTTPHTATKKNLQDSHASNVSVGRAHTGSDLLPTHVHHVPVKHRWSREAASLNESPTSSQRKKDSMRVLTGMYLHSAIPSKSGWGSKRIWCMSTYKKISSVKRTAAANC